MLYIQREYNIIYVRCYIIHMLDGMFVLRCMFDILINYVKCIVK